jgi:hypothetical protein
LIVQVAVHVCATQLHDGGIPQFAVGSLLEYNVRQPKGESDWLSPGGLTTMRAPQIDSYRFGHLVVDGQVHTGDLIVLPDQVIGGWWRQQGHSVQPGDLEIVLRVCPDVLIVGQGANGRMRVTAAARRALQAAGIELITQPTEQACEAYNQLRTQRRVAAALHLTC